MNSDACRGCFDRKPEGDSCPVCGRTTREQRHGAMRVVAAELEARDGFSLSSVEETARAMWTWARRETEDEWATLAAVERHGWVSFARRMLGVIARASTERAERRRMKTPASLAPPHCRTCMCSGIRHG